MNTSLCIAIFVFWVIDASDQMVFLKMTLHNRKYSDNYRTILSSFVKYFYPNIEYSKACVIGDGEKLSTIYI